MRSRVLTYVLVSAASLPSLAQAQTYSTPLGCEDCINYWYFVDQGGQDYACGDRTYDGHYGSDYSLRGGNNAIDDGNEVVAAADGVVIVASDGSFDRCTACGGDGCGLNTPGSGFANHVVIDHGTHNTTYGHMRLGSVRVQAGDSVKCGDVIGEIGSSGCSTGAHLHFQPRYTGERYDRAPLDPYEGDCSPTEASLWSEQGPYPGVPGAACEAIAPDCPEGLTEIWTCSNDAQARQRCVDGMDFTEACEWGCEAAEIGDAQCALPPDADDDGFRVDTDCDDAEPSVNPGAIEVCGNAIDEDCSGEDQACDPDDSANAGGGGMGGGAGGEPPSEGGASSDGEPSGGSNDAATSGGSGASESGGATVSEEDAAVASTADSGVSHEAGCTCASVGSSPSRDVCWWSVVLLAVFAFRKKRSICFPTR